MHRRAALIRTLSLFGLTVAGLGGAVRPAVAAEGKAPSLNELFEYMARAEGFSAEFVETKKIAFLKAPLENRGRIYFAPPGRFARHVDKPTASSLYLDGGRLVVVDASGKKSLDLGATPAVRQLLESVLHLLAGKRAAIEAAYALGYTTTGPSWRLRLEPKSEALRGILKQLEFAGTGLSLGEMKLVESSGDVSNTTFQKVEHGRKFTQAEMKKYLTPPA